MPSPLAHALAGWAVYRGGVRGGTGAPAARTVAAAAIALSLAPDLDALPGLATGNLGRYHNNMSHSVLFALAVALLVAAAAHRVGGWSFGRWFTLALTCYMLHVTMDFFTVGRGVMLAWPFSEERFQSPVKLFYGLRWSDGWISMRHLWTLFSEVGSAVLIGVVVRFWPRRKA